MKKLLLTFAGLALTSFLAPAQVALITRTGASLATIHASAAGPARQYAAGWVGGAGLNLPLDRVQVVSLQPEVLFNRKGFAMRGNHYVHNYLEVPLLLKVTLKRYGLQTYLTAGPSGGFLLSGRYPAAMDTLGVVRTDDLPVRVNQVLNAADAPTTAFKRFELGFQVGAGVGLPLGRGTALAELRYGHGLTPFFRTDGPAGAANRFTNRAFGLTLAYALPLAVSSRQ
ncbi:MAG: PorT family protein [Cytophagales bacterium]|nr:PorT family protein [Cytophagales bacterium]